MDSGGGRACRRVLEVPFGERVQVQPGPQRLHARQGGVARATGTSSLPTLTRPRACPARRNPNPFFPSPPIPPGAEEVAGGGVPSAPLRRLWGGGLRRVRGGLLAVPVLQEDAGGRWGSLAGEAREGSQAVTELTVDLNSCRYMV